MTRLSVVADAGPLIALAQIGLLEAFGGLFQSCLIPPMGAREIAPSVQRPPWIVVRPLGAPIDEQVLLANLDPGETEVLALASEIADHGVLVDDLSARRFADAIGLPMIGTVGLVLFAKEQGVLPTVRPSLDALLAAGFYVSHAVIEQALQRAGETQG
ncbi:MAG: DUF3368 domain-containing protein [Thermomicrobiales bacterium]